MLYIQIINTFKVLIIILLFSALSNLNSIKYAVYVIALVSIEY